MLVKEFAQKSGFEMIAGVEALNKEISGVFTGDLLSWVMGNCEAGDLWITVQSHLNVVAVSALKEISALVLAQSALPTQEMLDKAFEENIAVFTTSLSAYEVCRKCVELGL